MQSPLHLCLSHHGGHHILWTLHLPLHAATLHFHREQTGGRVLHDGHTHAEPHHLHTQKCRGENHLEEAMGQES